MVRSSRSYRLPSTQALRRRRSSRPLISCAPRAAPRRIAVLSATRMIPIRSRPSATWSYGFMRHRRCSKRQAAPSTVRLKTRMRKRSRTPRSSLPRRRSSRRKSPSPQPTSFSSLPARARRSPSTTAIAIRATPARIRCTIRCAGNTPILANTSSMARSHRSTPGADLVAGGAPKGGSVSASGPGRTRAVSRPAGTSPAAAMRSPWMTCQQKNAHRLGADRPDCPRLASPVMRPC